MSASEGNGKMYVKPKKADGQPNQYERQTSPTGHKKELNG